MKKTVRSTLVISIISLLKREVQKQLRVPKTFLKILKKSIGNI